MVRQSAVRHALQEADTLLPDLDVDQEAPVDVFCIVDRLGLWLVFNPLKSLLGAAVPTGDGGIMVTTERGPAVQRFTAAHEIGHWVLDYGEAAFDTEQDIYRPDADREILAQIFASQLLMPPPLVYGACARYGVEDSQSAAPDAVYLVARDIGASYEATARQLANLEIISGRRRDELLKIQPAVINSELCLGHRPAGAVDVWPVGLDSIGSTVTAAEGDEIIVLLPENRTTGHRWLTADDLARRSRRPHGEPPEIDVSASAAPTQANSWKPGRVPSAKSIDVALDRIPGNWGNVRILPQQEPQAPAPLEIGRPLAWRSWTTDLRHHGVRSPPRSYEPRGGRSRGGMMRQPTLSTPRWLSEVRAHDCLLSLQCATGGKSSKSSTAPPTIRKHLRWRHIRWMSR